MHRERKKNEKKNSSSTVVTLTIYIKHLSIYTYKYRTHYFIDCISIYTNIFALIFFLLEQLHRQFSHFCSNTPPKLNRLFSRKIHCCLYIIDINTHTHTHTPSEREKDSHKHTHIRIQTFASTIVEKFRKQQKFYKDSAVQFAAH